MFNELTDERASSSAKTRMTEMQIWTNKANK